MVGPVSNIKDQAKLLEQTIYTNATLDSKGLFVSQSSFSTCKELVYSILLRSSEMRH